jgi:hypothetical protein
MSSEIGLLSMFIPDIYTGNTQKAERFLLGVSYCGDCGGYFFGIDMVLQKIFHMVCRLRKDLPC